MVDEDALVDPDFLPLLSNRTVKFAKQCVVTMFEEKASSHIVLRHFFPWLNYTPSIWTNRNPAKPLEENLHDSVLETLQSLVSHEQLIYDEISKEFEKRLRQSGFS